MKAKISEFAIFVEAIIYMLLCNLHDCTQWFHQLVIFRNDFALILTLSCSFLNSSLQINSCSKSVLKRLGESATFG